MDVAQSLQELRAVVEKARSLPMSTSAVISRTEVLGLVDQLQARFGTSSLPRTSWCQIVTAFSSTRAERLSAS